MHKPPSKPLPPLPTLSPEMIDHKNRETAYLLSAALSTSKEEAQRTAQAALAHGANVNGKKLTAVGKWILAEQTPLATAIDFDHAEIVRLLLDNGANTNNPKTGVPFLDRAVERGASDLIIKLLLPYAGGNKEAAYQLLIARAKNTSEQQKTNKI